ncbi:hypothetical protein LCGC14_0208980 [marine sediment metagenome]|uniref:Uncharacterized protein n=1 Tax=marine sediment metagenome TaxID=412755 RepID=A0A0F9UY27_9ZZZZ
MILNFINMLAAAEPDPTVHIPGKTKNVADIKFRKSQREYERIQRAKGGQGGSAGWNTQAAQALRERPGFGKQGGQNWSPTTTSYGGPGQPGAPTPVYVQSTYPLGAPSKAFMDKYKRWGAGGIRSNTGWRNTLTMAPSPQSNTQSQRLHTTEGIQTRETRRQDWRDPFVVLSGYKNTPQLNPNLSYMFNRKSYQLGPVRRAVSRLI